MDNQTLTQNAPNNSLMFATYTPTFGNMNFMIQPSQTGRVSNTFGTIPYLSLESLIYMQQMNAQVSPTNVMSGQNGGQQNIQGSLTVQDSFGNARLTMGYSQGGY
jgi:hypothetical protein